MNKWIYCKDDLPKRSVTVLTCQNNYDNGHPIQVSFYNATGNYFEDERGLRVYPYAWMPLPALAEVK